MDEKNRNGAAMDTGGGSKFKLSREYEYEGKKIRDLDIFDRSKVTAERLTRVERRLRSMMIEPSMATEETVSYALAFGEQFSGLPLDFFNRLDAHDAYRLKLEVARFLKLPG